MKFHLNRIILAAILVFLTTLSVRTQEVRSINELLLDTAFLDKLPIPISAISVNSDQTQTVIEEVEESLGFTPEQLDRIDSILNDFNTELNKFKELVNDEFLSSSSAILFDKTTSDIKQVDERVNGYREIVQSEIQDKEKDNKRIDKLIIIWNKTSESERSTSFSNAIKQNLKEIIAELNDIDKRIGKYLNNLLELELKLNESHSSFEVLIKSINTARGDVSKNLLIPDIKPIWKI